MMGVRLAGVILWAGLATAQTGPNFSGTWEPVSSSDPAAPGIVQVVTQTNTTLALEHASSNDGHRFLYKTDGSENRLSQENHGALIESVARVTVKDGDMTIARVTRYPDGRVRENTQVWSLTPEGHLVIEATDGLRGEAPVTRKVVYKKRVLIKN